ncbi:MAG: BNR-4 repeat-containing protein, partial [Gemmatimonadota bacterium]
MYLIGSDALSEIRNHRRTGAFLLFVLAAGIAASCEPEAPEARPAQEYPALTSDGAWCWFGDPRAVRFRGAHDRIYAGWVDSNGSIIVSSYDLDTGEQVEHSLHTAFNRDDHANPSIYLHPDGTVVVFYTSHGSDVSQSMYYRMSQRPEDITAWDELREVGANTEGPRGHTYPNPVRLSEEGGRTY